MFESFDINFVIFGVMPYVALTVFLVGSIARYERDPFTWKSSSSQLLRRKQLIWGSILFHVGILTVFFGHLVGLFTPVWVLDALGVPYGLKQWMAVLIGGPAGLAALIGGTMLIHRRLTDPRIRATSTTLDILIMILIWLQLAIGLLAGGGCATNQGLLPLARPACETLWPWPQCDRFPSHASWQCCEGWWGHRHTAP